MRGKNLPQQAYTLQQAVIQLGLDDVNDVLSHAMANEIHLMFRLPTAAFILECGEDAEYVEHYAAKYAYLNIEQCEQLKFDQLTKVVVPFDFPCQLDDDVYYDSIRRDKGFRSENAELYFAAKNSLGLKGEIVDDDGFLILPPLSVDLDRVWISVNELDRLKERLELNAIGAVNDQHRESMLCTKPRYDGELVYGVSEAFFEAMCGCADLAWQLASPHSERIRWSIFEASRRLAGIAPENYPENQALCYIQPHDAVFAAQGCADQIFNLAGNEQFEYKTPQDWLAWAEEAQITVYPPCRRLIEYWRGAIAQKQISHQEVFEENLGCDGEDGNEVRWRKILHDLWPDILQKYPTKQLADKVMLFLREHDSTGCIGSETTKSHLHWVDEEGRSHFVARKTVQNALSELRMLPN